MPTLTVRPLHLTSRPRAWHTLLRALGATPLTFDTAPDAPWQVWSLPGGGRLALHGAEANSVRDGVALLSFEVADLEAHLEAHGAAVAAAGGRLERHTADHGATLRLSLPDSTFVLLDAAEHPATDAAPDEAHGAAVNPIVFTPDPRGVADVLAAAGLRTAIEDTAGRWFELAGDGNLGVHVGQARAGGATPREANTSGGFVAADLEPLAERLRSAGIRCDLVDEAYGRTLLVEHPDAPESGEADLPGRRLWINEVQRDTYGYVDHR